MANFWGEVESGHIGHLKRHAEKLNDEIRHIESLGMRGDPRKWLSIKPKNAVHYDESTQRFYVDDNEASAKVRKSAGGLFAMMFG